MSSHTDLNRFLMADRAAPGAARRVSRKTCQRPLRLSHSRTATVLMPVQASSQTPLSRAKPFLKIAEDAEVEGDLDDAADQVPDPGEELLDAVPHPVPVAGEQPGEGVPDAHDHVDQRRSGCW